MATGPLVAPAGTVTETNSALILANVVADTPLKLTAFAPSRSLPQMTMDLPAGPLAGRSPVILGFGPGIPKSHTQAALPAIP